MDGFWIWFLITVLVVLGINFLIAYAIAQEAKRKGRSWALFFWLSFLVSWFVMLIVLLLIKPEDNTASQNDDKDLGAFLVQCTYCKESIRADAIVCKHCHRDIEPALPRLLKQRQIQIKQDEIQAKELQEEKTKLAKETYERSLENSKKTKQILKSPIFIIPTALVFIFATSLVVYFSSIQQTKEANTSELAKLTKECDEYLPSGITYQVWDNNSKIDIQPRGPITPETTKWINCVGQKISIDPPTQGLGDMSIQNQSSLGSSDEAVPFDYGNLEVYSSYELLRITRN